MVVRVLSDFIDEVREQNNLQGELYLAVKYDAFQQRIVTSINEIFQGDKEEALFMLQVGEGDNAKSQKCSECQSLDEMIQQANLRFMTEGPEAAVDYLKKRRQEHLVEHQDKVGLCSNYFLNFIHNPILAYEMVRKITQGPSKDLEVKREKWKDVEPRRCADLISSMSNPHRLFIIKLLKNNEQSFTEISEMTGLRTGHLQFHLRILLEKGLVEKEERGIYRLNAKGEVALDYLADFENSISLLDNRK